MKKIIAMALVLVMALGLFAVVSLAALTLNKKKFKETFGIDIPHWRDSLYCFAEDFKRGN